jgi:hypothetical protein
MPQEEEEVTFSLFGAKTLKVETHLKKEETKTSYPWFSTEKNDLLNDSPDSIQRIVGN